MRRVLNPSTQSQISRAIVTAFFILDRPVFEHGIIKKPDALLHRVLLCTFKGAEL
jgi:hypothetical protein